MAVVRTRGGRGGRKPQRILPILSILSLVVVIPVVHGQPLPQSPVRVDYLDKPETEWQRGLGLSLPVDGNGLFLSPPLDDDDSNSRILYVTAGDGSLHAIDPNGGGAIMASIVPKPIADGWTIRGTSGVALYSGRNPLLVYAITDVPPSDDYATPVQSRIVAVRHAVPPTLLWTSAVDLMVGSEVAGTPVISSDGQRIFFTRNSVPLPDPPTNAPVSALPSTRPSLTPSSGPVAATTTTTAPVVAAPIVVAPLTNTTNTTTTTTTTNETATGGRRRRTLQEDDDAPPAAVAATVAHFTVLNAEDGSMVRNDPSTSLLLTNHKYAPVGLARNVTTLLFSDGIVVNGGMASDLIVWHGAGDASIDGGGDTQLYQYVSPNITDMVPAKQLNSASWTTHGPPVVTNNGELFFLTTDGILRGWTDGRNFDLTPNFQVAVVVGTGTTTTTTTGSSTTGTFTDAPQYVNGLLYVTVANSAVAAVSVQDVKLVWDVKSKSGSAVILARPVLSPDYQRLYVAIGSEIHVVNAVTGQYGGNNAASPYWATPFGNEDGSLIVADPAVSHDGRFVYYVGIQRQIVTALKVGRSLAPTELPSIRPSLAPSSSRAPSPPPVPPVPAPTRPPRTPGAAGTDEDIEQDKKKSAGDNVPLLAGTIGGGLGAVLLLGLAYFIYKKRKGGGGDDGIDPDYRYDYGGGSGRS